MGQILRDRDSGRNIPDKGRNVKKGLDQQEVGLIWEWKQSIWAQTNQKEEKTLQVIRNQFVEGFECHVEVFGVLPGSDGEQVG